MGISNARITLNGAATLDNQLGLIYAPDVLAQMGALNNTGGSLSGQTVELLLSGQLLNNSAGTVRGVIAAMSDTGPAELTIQTSGRVNNSGGTLQSDGANFTLTSGELNNDEGRILHLSDGRLALSSTDRLSNQNGTLLSDGAMEVSVQELVNQKGSVTAEKRCQLTPRAVH